ncbi:TPM domain-containing protein [Candidatus Saccharibacteria bacterium]|nr:TPM domain-containing protein [Candidatus Saccharibacteria bacterium]
MKLRHVLVGLVVAVVATTGLGFIGSSAYALDVPKKPTDIPVVDQTNTLSEEQKVTLAEQIAAERTKSGNQIAVLIIPTLENESIEDYSLKVAREWGVGTSQNSNGVLLLVAKNDRRLRIEVGTGLEGALTDVQTGRIIRNDITPLFKQDDYYGGIKSGITCIVAAINGEYKAAGTVTNDSAQKFPWELVLFGGFMGLSWLGSILARTKSWWAGGVVGGLAGGIAGLLASSIAIGLLSAGILAVIGLFFDRVVSKNYRSHARRGENPSWWAGGGSLGGGGGSGGGFGGFGGGSFGGGGSSGSW